MDNLAGMKCDDNDVVGQNCRCKMPALQESNDSYRIELLEKRVQDLELEVKQHLIDKCAMQETLDSLSRQVDQLVSTVQSLSPVEHCNGTVDTCVPIQLEGDRQPKSSYSNSISSSETVPASKEPSWTTAEDLANSIKSAAEEALGQTGVVYDKSSGLYYDWNFQMYYDPNTMLYYDNDNGIYYHYDHETKSLKFHMQVAPAPVTVDDTNNDASKDDELSEGEILSEDESKPEEAEWPPGIRAIVMESESDCVGSLNLVTYLGGCIGRCDIAKPKYVINLKDPSVSKTHAKISYDTIQELYLIQDLGSVNGTFLNDERLSEAKEKSPSSPLKHGDILQVGNTVLLIHIHKGNETCDECEPGQVMAAIAKELQDQSNSISKEYCRKTQLKLLKKKYQLNQNSDVKTSSPDYNDRAKIRRITVKATGGEVHEQTPVIYEKPASLNEEIADSNVGHIMLQKMGWKSGEGLGKNKSGIKQPVSIVKREKQKGLGSSVVQSVDDISTKSYRWHKARERYDDIASQQ